MSDSGADGLLLATRGSDLARRQAASVRAALADERIEAELVEMETTGDRVRDELVHRLGKTGAFVRALDEAVLDGEVDAAVHSMKDMPTEMPEGLVVAAVPRRAAPGDVLVTADGATLEELARRATVGTSSQRRRAQLLAARPDLDVRPLRGNVDTRVEKVLAPALQREHERRLDAAGEGDDADGETAADDDGGDGEDGEAFDRDPETWFSALAEVERRALGRAAEAEYDAAVLAAAGLSRSGLDAATPTAPLPTDEFVPAPGQGALAVVARDGDVADRLNRALDHARSRVETTVERTVLAAVGGGCIAPVGAYAVVQGDVVSVRAAVLHPEGTERAAVTRDLPIEDYLDAAREVAADLRAAGADAYVAAAEAAVEEAPEGDGP